MTLLLQEVDSVLADTTQAATAPETMSILDTLLLGGWVMVPILLLSLATIYLFIERLMTLRRATTDPAAITERIRDYVQAGNIHGAQAYCDAQDKPITRIPTG